MGDCGCFYCKQCYQDSNSRDDFDKSCVICGKKKRQAFDLQSRHELKMVEKNLLEMKSFMTTGLKLAEVSPSVDSF